MKEQRRASRSHTKSGPGRYHGQCGMFVFNERRIVKNPQQRLAPAITGGSWKGLEYLTLAEHDRCTRAALNAPAGSKPDEAFVAERRRIIDARRAA